MLMEQPYSTLISSSAPRTHLENSETMDQAIEPLRQAKDYPPANLP